MSKYERLARMLKIVTLVKANPNLSRTDLARLCEVDSVRTIQRDINSLSLAEIPIYWNGQGYEIMPNFFLPPMALTIDEAFSVVLSVKTYSEGEGQFHKNTLESAISKILSTLPASAKELLETGTSQISVESRKSSDTGGLIGKIYQAIMEAKQLRINYYSYSSNETSERVIDPYTLTFRRRSWYLIGYCHNKQKVLTFRTSRIRTMKYTGESFKPPQDFSIDDYMGKSWQVMTGVETKVIVRFNSEIAPLIKEVEWHPTQQIIDLPDGSVLFVATVAGTKEISLWILSYGDKAEVLFPEKLRKEMINTARKMYRRYRPENPEESDVQKKANEIALSLVKEA
jgi:predicted DNA-binding transcriptional regulator YafY